MKFLEVILWLVYALYGYALGVGMLLILINGLVFEWGEGAGVKIALSQIPIVFSSLLLSVTLIWVGSVQSKSSEKLMIFSDVLIFVVFVVFVVFSFYLRALPLLMTIIGGHLCLLAARFFHKRKTVISNERDTKIVFLRIGYASMIFLVLRGI